MTKRNLRAVYGILFCVIFIIEALIALFVRDRFIRPYGGDVLVVVLICCFVRVFFPTGVKLLPLWVFIFAVLVEIGQYFDYVTLLGLGDIRFFRVLLGTSFSVADLICYGGGCLLFFVCETLWRRKLSLK